MRTYPMVSFKGLRTFSYATHDGEVCHAWMRRYLPAHFLLEQYTRNDGKRPDCIWRCWGEKPMRAFAVRRPADPNGWTWIALPGIRSRWYLRIAGKVWNRNRRPRRAGKNG